MSYIPPHKVAEKTAEARQLARKKQYAEALALLKPLEFYHRNNQSYWKFRQQVEKRLEAPAPALEAAASPVVEEPPAAALLAAAVEDTPPITRINKRYRPSRLSAGAFRFLAEISMRGAYITFILIFTVIYAVFLVLNQRNSALYGQPFGAKESILFLAVALGVSLLATYPLLKLFQRFAFRVHGIHTRSLALQTAWFKKSPTEFEHIVAAVLELELGYTAKVVGGPGDDGVDIVLLNKRLAVTALVQVKRYNPKHPIENKEIRELRGAMVHKKIKRGYFVTSSYFRRNAYKYARSLDITLIDGKQLALWQAQQEHQLQ